MKLIIFGLMFVAAAPAADLPVKQVILYKHGVGYFERAGDLRAGESAKLDFKANEMNDVLKSLTISEAGGGKVAGVRYDSSDPLSKRLGEYPFKLGDQISLAAFLDQLKGSRVELKMGAETVAGAIVSGRAQAATEKSSARELLVLLADSGALQTVDLSASSSVKLQDPALQQQLKDYLTAVANSRSMDQRSVYIDSTDKSVRQVSAAYMIPMAVWKSSYRLIFGASGDPTLEGWAIIDNTTAEDWINVRLALVSGRPISFISRLYEPKYINRQVAELSDDQPQGPQLFAGTFERLDRFANLQKAPQLKDSAPAPPPAPSRAGAFAGYMEKDRVALEMAPSSVAATSEGRELGDLFEYRFSSPVTVKKNESAMLPFLQQKLGARKLLIYSSQSQQNPWNAAELTNSTGKTLDGGPITVFDANAYAGEALVETLKAGDKRLISYGIDLGTRVTTAFESDGQSIREFHLNRGILTSRAARRETRTYTIRNVDQKAKTLIIEHTVRHGYKLITPEKPSETTANAYRFEVKLGPGATEKFVVTEENVYDQTYSISSLSPDLILTFTRNKAMTDAGRRQLEGILAQKRQIAAADKAVQAAEGRINEIGRDQERTRQNIGSLNAVSGQQEQVQRYAKQLADQESQLAALRDEAEAQRKRKSALELELNALIEKLDF